MRSLKKLALSALLSSMLSLQVSADCSYELFNISSAKDTKITDFIDQLSDQCEFSVIVSDPHAQKFMETSLNKTHLKNLTITEVLDIILLENNLSYKLENNLLKISYLTTKVFGIDYILSQRKATASTDVTLSSSNSEAGGTTQGGEQGGSASTAQSGIKIETNDEVKFWEQLDLELQQVLNRPEDVYEASSPIINKNAGLITVTATVKQMNRLEAYLKKLQEKVQLQVLIDVQLLSVTMSEGKTTGVDWSQLYQLQNIDVKIDNKSYNYTGTFDAKTNDMTDIAGSTAREVANLISIKAEVSLNEVVKFLQSQGDVSSISNPKVLTLNNQPALITAGTEYFYKVKSSTSQQGSGGGVAATTQDESVESVFAGVLLNITPEIADDRTVTLKINPSLSETKDDLTQGTSSDRVMPPDLNRRQLSSVVTVKSGNRIILGGLINTKNIQESSKVPILGDIPVVSSLFRYESNSKQVEELVIVIEPHIIEKTSNDLSLADLGYEGINNDLIDYKNTKETAEPKVENEI